MTVSVNPIYLSALSFFSACLSDCNLPQEAVICVDDWKKKKEDKDSLTSCKISPSTYYSVTGNWHSTRFVYSIAINITGPEHETSLPPTKSVFPTKDLRVSSLSIIPYSEAGNGSYSVVMLMQSNSKHITYHLPMKGPSEKHGLFH